MIKKIKYLLLSAVIYLGILLSCNDLNYNEITINDEEWVFNNHANVDRLLSDVYARIRYDMGVGGFANSMGYMGAMLASATDEAQYAQPISLIHRYYNGAWSSVNAFADTWVNSYAAIYQANLFLEKMEQVMETLEQYKDNGINAGIPYEVLLRRFELLPHQARFLRAHFHFELAKTYGDVPLITRSLMPQEASELTRTPVQTVFKFIMDECDAITDFLPINYLHETAQANMGRAHRPAVLALKARTALYAASPLHNPTGDKELWRKAALANKALLDIAADWGVELLDGSEYNLLWYQNSHFSVPEIFFARRMPTDLEFEFWNYPVGHENSRGGNCPSQNLVDAYEFTNAAPVALRGMAFGEALDAGLLDGLANPYANLDPRFTHTIARNGERWPTVAPYTDDGRTLQTFEGGLNGSPTLNATPTGYYLKKYVDGSRRLVAEGQSGATRRSWIIYRLSEFYLNYAEAMFNLMDGDPEATEVAPLDNSANWAVNRLRQRAGLNLQLFGPMTSDQWMERYMRERKVELAFEGHRFWDVRRWKKGAEFFTTIKTIKVTQVEGNPVGRIERGDDIPRGWYEHYNLYPIPFGELIKAPGLTQNPGW
jgi:hypothetical protein